MESQQQDQTLVDRLAMLAQAAFKINSQLELTEVLRTICQEVSIFFKTNDILIYLLDPKRQKLQLSFAYGEYQERCVRTIPLELFAKYYGEKKRVSVISDLRSVEQHPISEFNKDTDRLSLFVLKLYCHHQLIGAIFIYNYGKEWNRTQEDYILLQGLAGQAATAIENARLYTKLQENQEKLRELHHQVLTAQEEERRRISRELHDEIGQALTGLKMKLEMILNLSCLHSAVRSELINVVAILNEALDQTRNIAYDLRPPGLETLGLQPALISYCRTFSSRVGIPINFEGSEPDNPSEEVCICFYRVLQEALTNVAKHAKASHVAVRLQSDAEFLTLEIEDNGIGAAYPEAGMDGVGILGMKERVEALGGTLNISTKLGEGWCLTARVPR